MYRNAALGCALALLLFIPAAAQAQSRPDLQISSMSFSPSSGAPGDRVQLSCRVRNAGTASAGSSTLQYLIVYTKTSGGSGSIQATDAVSSLSTGNSSSETYSFDVPADAKAGTMLAQCIADISGTVTESNESNNSRQESFSVLASVPDLRVSSMSLSPSSGERGASFTASCASPPAGSWG